MPSRIVREGIIHSSRMNSLSLGAEVLYRRLMSVADDYGRYHGSIPTLRASCWPHNPDKIREKDVSKWLNELLKGEEPLVRTYIIGGFTYVEIQNFGQQVRAKSRFPDPPWFVIQQDTEKPAKQMLSKCEADAQPSRIRITKSESDSNAKGEAPAAEAAGGLFDEAPLDRPTVVRPHLPSQKPKGKRATEEIRKALGARLPWWEQFWSVYPCHDGMNPAMDAFERRVITLEQFGQVLAGAKAYAFRATRTPDMRLKFGQGWINDERWTDEAEARASPGFGMTVQTPAERKRAETIAGMKVIEQIRRSGDVR